MILTTVLAAGAVPTEAPDADMLEFLGTYETSDGKWIDPTTLDDSAGEPKPTNRSETPS